MEKTLQFLSALYMKIKRSYEKAQSLRKEQLQKFYDEMFEFSIIKSSSVINSELPHSQ